MEEKEAFLESIRVSAEKAAESLVADAERERNKKLAVLREELAELEKKERHKAEADAALILSRRRSAARLQSTKTILTAKQELVDAVYRLARERILDMPDDTYREWIAAFIAKFAEDGDAVIFAKRDCGRFPSDFIENIARKRGISLTVSDETHGEEGGVILSGKRIDKNLTLPSLFALARERTEVMVAGTLFGN